MRVNCFIMCYLMHQFDGISCIQRDVLFCYYWLVDRVECPILVDEVEAGCQLPILTIVVGWRVGKPFEYYFLSCWHVLEFKFGLMIS